MSLQWVSSSSRQSSMQEIDEKSALKSSIFFLELQATQGVDLVD